MRVNQILENSDQPPEYAIRITISNRTTTSIRYFQQKKLKGKTLEQAGHINNFSVESETVEPWLIGSRSIPADKEPPTLYTDKQEVIKQAKQVQAACNRISAFERQNFGMQVEYFVKPVVWKGIP